MPQLKYLPLLLTLLLGSPTFGNYAEWCRLMGPKTETALSVALLKEFKRLHRLSGRAEPPTCSAYTWCTAPEGPNAQAFQSDYTLPFPVGIKPEQLYIQTYAEMRNLPLSSNFKGQVHLVFGAPGYDDALR